QRGLRRDRSTTHRVARHRREGVCRAAGKGGQKMRTIRLRVNGQPVVREVPDNRLLVDFLRYDLGLTGTKEGCSVGVCGACTVLMDGDMISSCLTLTVMADGHDITTVEGLAKNGELNPVQKSFIQYGGFQCGNCPTERKPEAQRRTNQRLDDGQSLPLHRLLQNYRVD